MAISKRPTRQIPRAYEEDGEEDEEEVVTPTRPNEKLRRGWSAGEQTMASTSSFAQALRPEEKAQVVKFLEDEPYANYRRHWIERSSATGRTVRSYTCLQSFDRDCPLCEAGDRAQAVAAFNVALIGDDGVATLKSWDVGPKIFGILKGYANDPKIAPLSRGYFLVSRTGKKGTTNHQVIPVKPNALEEDYDVPPPSKEDLARLKVYTADVIDVPTRKTLEEIAAEFADEYS